MQAVGDDAEREQNRHQDIGDQSDVFADEKDALAHIIVIDVAGREFAFKRLLPVRVLGGGCDCDKGAGREHGL